MEDNLWDQMMENRYKQMLVDENYRPKAFDTMVLEGIQFTQISQEDEDTDFEDFLDATTPRNQDAFLQARHFINSKNVVSTETLEKNLLRTKIN